MKRCGECGSTYLSRKNIKGSLHPWKDYSQVELLLDQDVLVCEKCGNQIMTMQDLRKLDENIAQSLLLKINNAITYLTTKYKVTQEDLAIALGRTPEYVSMIKNGKRKPAFGTFNLLMSFQHNPQLLTSLAGVKIVEPVHLWEGPRALSVYVGGSTADQRMTDSRLAKEYSEMYRRQWREAESAGHFGEKVEIGTYPVYHPTSRLN